MKFSQLSHRERLFLVVGGGSLLIVLLCFGILAPYFDSLDRLDSQIASRGRQLQQMRRMQVEYRQWQARMVQPTAADSGDFALLSFLETTAGRIAGRDNLVAMRPQPAQVQNGYREELVELKLEKLILPDLIRLLHAMETSGAPVRVRSLRVKRRFDDPLQLDVTATIGSARRLP